MKILINIKEKLMRHLVLASISMLSVPAWAGDDGKTVNDPVQEFMSSTLQSYFGSSAGFWKAFILADIMLATFASLKNKNPMTFVGVFMTALVPGYLVRTYVFY